MFGTLFKRIYKSQSTSQVSLMASAAYGSESISFPDAVANDPVTLLAFNELAQHVCQASRATK